MERTDEKKIILCGTDKKKLKRKLKGDSDDDSEDDTFSKPGKSSKLKRPYKKSPACSSSSSKKRH